MKTEKQVRDMLKIIEKGEDFRFIVVKDVGLEEVRSAKQVLRWVLDED